MPVIQLPATALRVGQPVPVALRDAAGHLLVPRGAMVESEERLAQLISRGIFVDEGEGQQFKKAMAQKVDSLLRSNVRLGQIAKAQIDAPIAPSAASAAAPNDTDALATGVRKRAGDPIGALNSLLLRASALLHDPQAADFAARVAKIDAELLDMLNGDADAVLLMLIHSSTRETHKYSVSHALLVSAICELAARHIPLWTGDHRVALRYAALTMNIAMTELQNQLVMQEDPLSARQRDIVDHHAVRGAEMMRGFGVSNELWLQAVQFHHASPSGPLAELPPTQQLARLLQRSDIFAARLSPRHKRQALSASAAARAAYLDEEKKADESGSAIVKALGIYPPGSFVQLANAEIAVVLRRGRRATEPLVASIVSKSGTPMGVPAVRDTRMPVFAISAGVAPHDVRVRLNIETLLQLF